jgi:hypothetical protein
MWNFMPYYAFAWGTTHPHRDCAEVRLIPTSGAAALSTENSGPWRVRLECDADLARQNPECAEWIGGTFELPAELLSPEDLPWDE